MVSCEFNCHRGQLYFLLIKTLDVNLVQKYQFCVNCKNLGLLPPSSEGWGKVIFSVCVSVHTGRYPHQVLTGGYPILPNQGGHTHPSQLGDTPIVPEGGTPLSRSQVRMGVPPPSRSGLRSGWGGGYPNWNSIACTCYAAGSMPLTFTQEDFLVSLCSDSCKF